MLVDDVEDPDEIGAFGEGFDEIENEDKIILVLVVLVRCIAVISLELVMPHHSMLLMICSLGKARQMSLIHWMAHA